MKMQSLKAFIVCITILTATNSLKAQTENINERFSTQLKNGTVPGLQFSRNVPAPASAATSSTSTEKKESLIALIRKGTAPGMKFMPVSTAGPTTMSTPVSQKANSGPLASEQEINKEQPKTLTTPTVIPSQEETKSETPAIKH